jgi:uncharacterized membrane protein
MRKTNKALMIMWVLALIPVAIIAIVYNNLPEIVPMHWSFGGRVRYDPKINIWWFAVIPPVLAALYMLLPKIDPRKKSYEKFRGFYDSFVIVVMLFMIGVVGVVISESFTPGRLRLDFIVAAAFGLLFVFMGNMMPKVKSNFFIGIRTPWTLSNTEIWHKTHRLGGYLWFFSGFLVLIISFILSGNVLFITLIAIGAAISIIPAAMSYVWYRKLL